MDDLQRRFASLDRVPTPDLWAQIESRALLAGAVEVVRPEPGPARARGRARRRSIVMLGASVALLVALLAGALLVGSGSQPTSPVDLLGAWTGPVHREGAAFVVQAMIPMDWGSEWSDGRDADIGWIDIDVVTADRGSQPMWRLVLAARPPRADDPGHPEITTYGLVLETTGDNSADFVVGLDNSATQPGDFRAWVTDLATNETTEQVGPPYGFPVEFSHPDEQTSGEPPSVLFTFLGGTPAAVFGSGPLRFYAWATVTVDGEVVAWDYAPDVSWLDMGPRIEPLP